MATTSYLTGNNLTKKAFDEKLFRDAVKEVYFGRFMGQGPDSIVQVKTQLEKGKGDKITFGLRMRATGTGVTGTSILEGNEESLTTYDASVTLERYRHAVEVLRGISAQRVAFDIEDEAKIAIKDWGAEKTDKLCFDALFDASPSKVFYRDGSGVFTSTGTPATAKGALSAANSKLTVGFIQQLKTWATTGGARAGGQVPLRPIKINGKNHLVLLAHPDFIYDLKQDADYEAYLQNAGERGDSNPLFSGMVANVDGVIIHSHENCPIGTDGGGGSVAWGQLALLGAQSLCWAWGERPETISVERDYKERVGYAWAMTCGVTRPVFNSKDFGSCRAYLARTNTSGA